MNELSKEKQTELLTLVPQEKKMEIVRLYTQTKDAWDNFVQLAIKLGGELTEIQKEYVPEGYWEARFNFKERRARMTRFCAGKS